MKKALDYAVNFARERGMPVVCNLSYGVESVIEGNSKSFSVMKHLFIKNRRRFLFLLILSVLFILGRLP